MRRWCAVTLLVVLGGAGLGACGGDDGPTAEEQAQEAVCQDADGLQRSVETLIDDITDGNFGDAQEQLSKVESAFDALVASAKDLTGEKQQTIQDQLTEVQSTLTDLTSLESLTDIGTTLDTARSQLEAVVTTVTDTISCD